MWYSYCLKSDKKDNLFIASWLPLKIRGKLKHIDNLDKNLHMTILYAENFVNKKDHDKIIKSVKDICKNTKPIECQLSEVGIMGNGENTHVMNVTVHGGAEFYSNLVNAIEQATGNEMNLKFDFLPHVTINFSSDEKTINIDDLRKIKWTIDYITVQFGGHKSKKYKVILGG